MVNSRLSCLNDLKDEELVHLFAKGNNEAFDTLLVRHKKKVFDAIYFRVQDVDIANDLFQETFIKVIERIRTSQYDEQNRFLGWTLRIARNLTIDYYRKQHVLSTTLRDETNSEQIKAESLLLEMNIEESLIQEEKFESLNKWITLLPEEQQFVVRKRFYEDLSFKEIAESSNISINTALGRVRYALRNLKKMSSRY